jgi:glycosyltransferase involved in cell wall biosynthesis
MSRGAITHLLRAPIIGGSELETLTIVECLPEFTHRLVFPERYATWRSSIRDRFPPETSIIETPDVEAEIRRCVPGVLHIQFPFRVVDQPAGHDSVLELTSLPIHPGLRTLFTVHAAVNVPILEDIHYVFHTAALADRFQDVIPDARRTICPSPVRPPDPRTSDSHDEIHILWVSRDEEGKFHPQVPEICLAVLSRDPRIRFRFVGQSPKQPMPDHPRIESVACPVADLEEWYRDADMFWFFPDPRLQETWCRTVTEAMGAGLPCVVAGHGAMCHQVEHGRHGLVVDDVDSCIEALLDLAAAPEKRAAMAAAARPRATGFFDEAITTLRETYNRMLASLEAEARG